MQFYLKNYVEIIRSSFPIAEHVIRRQRMNALLWPLTVGGNTKRAIADIRQEMASFQPQGFPVTSMLLRV